MSEIEKMKRYIERTKMKNADKYCLLEREVCELFEKAKADSNGMFDALTLSFNYGKAKGYRAARTEARA